MERVASEASNKGRNRSNSLPSVADYLKRKREPIAVQDKKEEQIFQKSKKTSRSPDKRTKDISEEEMEAVLKKIDEMHQQFREELRKSRQQDREEIKNEIRKGNEEIREELRKREEAWKLEKAELKSEIKELTEKIDKLQRKEDWRERNERRNNIIVSGKVVKERKDVENIKAFVETVLREKLTVDVNIEEAAYITKSKKGEDIIKVVLKGKEDKIKIMKNKNKLKGTDIFINDDLTEEERRVQFMIRQKAVEERKAGKEVRIGYRKIQIEGKWRNWTELEGKKN